MALVKSHVLRLLWDGIEGNYFMFSLWAYHHYRQFKNSPDLKSHFGFWGQNTSAFQDCRYTTKIVKLSTFVKHSFLVILSNVSFWLWFTSFYSPLMYLRIDLILMVCFVTIELRSQCIRVLIKQYDSMTNLYVRPYTSCL